MRENATFVSRVPMVISYLMGWGYVYWTSFVAEIARVFLELANQASYVVTAFLTNTFLTVGTKVVASLLPQGGEPRSNNVALDNQN
jgi:hypothetical protein